MNFIAIGDNVADCYLDKGLYYPGGNAVNVAVNIKKCGAKKVEYIGVFGNDDMASHIEDSMKKEGIKIDRSRKVYAPSGQPAVDIGEDGDRNFVGSLKTSAQHVLSLQLTDEEYEYVKDFDLIHTSCYSAIDHLLEKMASSTKLSYDFSDEYDLAIIAELSKHLDYAFLSGSNLREDELKDIFTTAHKSGAKIVCITLGSKGSICSDGKNVYKQGIVETEVVDTMGAGDAFIAGFLYKHHESGDIKKAMEFGAKTGADACKIAGAFGYGRPLEK